VTNTTATKGSDPMSYILIDRPRPHVAQITLNRADRMNAMAFDVMIPLREAIDELSVDNEIRVVVLTGAGEGFCSGADQTDSGMPPNCDGLTVPTIALRALEVLDDVIMALRGMHQPVIAAINGPAIGGGLCLSLACDIRVASATAYFRAAGINNGLTASELGLSYLLPRAIGTTRATEIMLTGRDVSAEEATSIGLVSHVVPQAEVLETSYAIAEQIIGWSRPGIELTKRSLWASLDASSLQQHMQLEGIGQLFVRMLTQNFEEGTKARREKRTPVYLD